VASRSARGPRAVRGDRGARGARVERGGFGGPRGERGGFRGPRDDRGERGGYGAPRGERGGFRGPRDDRGERGGYGAPRGERGGFRGPRDDRSERGEREDRDRFRGPREEQTELTARPEESVAIPEDTTLDTTLDTNSPAVTETYEYEYDRSTVSSHVAAQMSPDVDLTQQSLALDLDAKLPVVHINNPTWHPIIYRKRVDRVVGNPRPGQLVAVYHSETEQLGYGLFNPNAEILVRMLRLGIEAPDEAYWKQRLDEAIALRRDVLQLDRVTDSYRVVHAEADGLSGLVVDKLGDTLSAEVFSVGMWQRARAVMEYLVERFQAQNWLIRTGPYVLEQEGFAADPLASEQLPAQVTIQEFGTRFRVRFEGGHKTGFFCDQRDNRRQLASYCAGRSVLDLCCYSGGFSVQAKKLGEAAEVTGVDIDEQPLKLARENANLNQVRVNFVKEDAFAYMRDMLRNGRQYDVVVLDPPKLITSRRDLEEGTRKHFDMNRLAMQLVKPGGMLLTCSCAGLLSEEEFQKLLYSASRQAGPELPTVGPDGKRRHAPRAMQILGRSGAAPDHPVSANCREGEYLKAYWLRMM
ncbi:MAG: class I SAM-dependent methyltransferase, partial [Planctomycetota bacterium]